MDIASLLDKIQLTDMEDLKLYFVSRTKTQNDNAPTFSVYEMRTDDSVRSFLYLSAISQLEEQMSHKEFLDFENSIEDFYIIPLDHNFPDKSFKIVISELRHSIPEMISSIAGISSKEEVCAQCIEFFDRDTEEKIFVFYRISSDSLNVKSPLNAVKMKLDPVSSHLSPVEDDVSYLNREIDGVFFRDNLLVFNKGHFEEMVEKYSDNGHESKQTETLFSY